MGVGVGGRLLPFPNRGRPGVTCAIHVSTLRQALKGKWEMGNEQEGLSSELEVGVRLYGFVSSWQLGSPAERRQFRTGHWRRARAGISVQPGQASTSKLE